jgi:hypothetical protein
MAVSCFPDICQDEAGVSAGSTVSSGRAPGCKLMYLRYFCCMGVCAAVTQDSQHLSKSHYGLHNISACFCILYSIQCTVGARFLSPPCHPYHLWGPMQPSIQWILGALSLLVKQRRSEAGPHLQLVPRSRVCGCMCTHPLSIVLNWLNGRTTLPSISSTLYCSILLHVTY